MLNQEKQFISDIQRCRPDLGFIRLNMKVEINAEAGIVKGVNNSANLNIIFKNTDKMGEHAHNCHPTWDICYFDDKDNIIADYREIRRIYESKQIN